MAGLPMHFTIDSDEEVDVEREEDEEEEEVKAIVTNMKKKKTADKPKFAIDFDTGELISASVSSKFKKAFDQVEEEESDLEGGKEDNVRAMAAVEQRIALNAKKTKKTKGGEAVKEVVVQQPAEVEEEEEQGMRPEEEKEYFDVVVDATRKAAQSSAAEEEAIMFSQLNLSRPFLRAVESMGYTHPTPIQTQVIPYALAGRDICASAVTGSGKTAAFSLPFLERLLYRPKDMSAIRVLVITPTRELAQQIHEVIVKLTKFTDISCALISGGKKDVKSQEATLRACPDIVICTPGRMLDHLRNSRSISLDDLDVLVLDEVDRLLDLGFQEEVEELVKHCPIARQTMLFSATMTPKVEDLIKLSLKKPVRVKTESSNSTVAPRLLQEFIKIRQPEEVEPILLSLVSRGFGNKTIVFFELKRTAHRFSALLNISGIKTAELHGDLPQTQRFLSLENFRTNQVDVLVATDVAARGLDISGVQTVINAEMPRNVSTYIHRVGRTARAGCGGRSITLVADERRKVMKDVLKGEATKVQAGKAQIMSRTIPSAVVSHYIAKIAGIEKELSGFFKQERNRLRLEALEKEATRAENLVTYSDEIAARPARTWFKTETQKEEIKEMTRQQVREERARAANEHFEKLPATEKARELARTDDYRVEEDDKKIKHRLSRVKRRRQEALKASEEEGDFERFGNMEAAPKKAKMAARVKEEKIRERSAGEIAMKKITIVEGGNGEDGDGPKRKKVKVVRQKFAVGGFDHDQHEWSGGSVQRMSKKQIREAARETSFEDFDPNKKFGKGGKKGHQAFKSKAKFKRRK